MKPLTKAYVFIALLCFAQVDASCDLPSLSNSPEGLTPSTGVSPSTLHPLQGEEEIPVINLGAASCDLSFKQPFSRSQTCPDLRAYEKSSTTSRQVSPPPERIPFSEMPTAVHVHQDSDVTDKSTSRSSSSTASCENKEVDPEVLLTYIALAYEGYCVSNPEKFPPPFQMPIEFLLSRGYKKIHQTVHYSVFENKTEKKTTISFAGTNTNNMHIAMGSCLFWKPSQFDAVGRALLPSFISSVVKKPFTTLMNAAIASSVLSTVTTMYSWASGMDILLPGLIASTSLVLSAIMWKNIASWIFFPRYLEHIHNIRLGIEPFYKDALKKGYEISFVGHSLGGHFAHFYAGFWPETKAYCISPPGGDHDQLSMVYQSYKFFCAKKDNSIRENRFSSKTELKERVDIYAHPDDPLTGLLAETDVTHNLLATHEGFGFQEGVDFHRIKNIYMMHLAKWYGKLIEENRKKS